MWHLFDIYFIVEKTKVITGDKLQKGTIFGYNMPPFGLFPKASGVEHTAVIDLCDDYHLGRHSGWDRTAIGTTTEDGQRDPFKVLMSPEIPLSHGTISREVWLLLLDWVNV